MEVLMRIQLCMHNGVVLITQFFMSEMEIPVALSPIHKHMQMVVLE